MFCHNLLFKTGALFHSIFLIFRLLQQFSFDQRKTQIGVLVDYATALFSTSKAQTSAEHAQLLVVISDGRGVFSEGQEKVCSCVRRARLAGIFMVFVIIDNPENKARKF